MMGIPEEEEERKKGTEAISTKLREYQAGQMPPKTITRHIIFKLQNITNKEKNLERNHRKKHLH